MIVFRRDIAGVNGTIHAVALQPDGKILVGGYLTTLSSNWNYGVTRLNADGSVDLTFAASFSEFRSRCKQMARC